MPEQGLGGITPTPDASPFERALRSEEISQAEFARRMGVAETAVSRWCAGVRRPPPQAYALLATFLAPGQALQLQREHEAWLAQREASARFTFITKLPEGVDRNEAEHVVAEAFARLAQRETLP
jgi:transcriptional regulator with XRE-family HTH domain